MYYLASRTVAADIAAVRDLLRTRAARETPPAGYCPVEATA